MNTIYSRIHVFRNLGNNLYEVTISPVVGRRYVSRYKWHISVIIGYEQQGVRVTFACKK